MVLLIFYFIDTLTIVFTNDIIGQLERSYATFINPLFPPPLGGERSFISFITEERKKGEVLLFDAGNMLGGYITKDEVNFKNVIEFYKKAGYNLIVPGKREFIFGKEGIDILKKNGVDLVCANITYADDTLKTVFVPYKIFKVKGIKIGVFGLSSWYIPMHLADDRTENFYFLSEIEVAQKIVKELKEKEVNVIICISNTGFEHEKRIARNVRGIDFIIGGGEGYGLRTPYEDYYTHTVILRNYRYFSGCGRLKLFFENKKLKGFDYKSITLFEEEF